MDLYNRADWAHELGGLLTREVVEAGVAPGGVIGVARRMDTGWHAALAAAGSLEPEHGTLAQARGPSTGSVLVTEQTVYDLASLTKPVVACLALGFEERSPGFLQEPLTTWLPQLSSTRAASSNLELLLTHRSGLSAHQELFAPLRAGGRINYEEGLQLAARAFREECTEPAQRAYPAVYSDLGYLLAGAAIEAHGQLALDLQSERWARQWELGGTLASARRLAAGVTIAPTEDVAWRGGRVRGLVHDENAFALRGDAQCGHAGLFGDARCMLAFGTCLLNSLGGRGPLRAVTLRHALAARPQGSYRLGFDSRSSEGSSAGRHFGPDSFGHLGFTGTSLWCDPAAEIAAVLLTNRVCPTRENIAIRQARPRIHDQIHQLCLAG